MRDFRLHKQFTGFQLHADHADFADFILELMPLQAQALFFYRKF